MNVKLFPGVSSEETDLFAGLDDSELHSAALDLGFDLNWLDDPAINSEEKEKKEEKVPQASMLRSRKSDKRVPKKFGFQWLFKKKKVTGAAAAAREI